MIFLNVLSRSCGQYKVEAKQEEPEPGEEDPLHAGREERAIKEEPDDGGVLQLIDKLEDVAENMLTRLVSTKKKYLLA